MITVKVAKSLCENGVTYLPGSMLTGNAVRVQRLAELGFIDMDFRPVLQEAPQPSSPEQNTDPKSGGVVDPISAEVLAEEAPSGSTVVVLEEPAQLDPTGPEPGEPEVVQTAAETAAPDAEEEEEHEEEQHEEEQTLTEEPAMTAEKKSPAPKPSDRAMPSTPRGKKKQR